ncbi:MAG TPA: caspase family protein, partial [Anaerolineales bacterium]|nr:caspase family protein [Anaerolineales bacterium]
MKYALIIGNDRYTDQKLAKLKTPAADSQALARVLKDQNIGSFDEVIPLINKTEVQVSRAISALLSNKKPEDLVLVYFSGHGVLDDRGRLFLALKDTQTSLLKSTAIPSSFIADEMDSCRSKRQILILDCCHSGAFERGVKSGEQRAITETTFEGSGFGRVVLTASASTQYALEGDQVIKQTELSLFTHFLLEGLQTGKADKNNDGYISLDEWYDYAYLEVLSSTPKQVPQKWSYHQQGDVIIGRNPVWKKKAAELPVDLVKLLESPYSSAREIAVKELGDLLHSHDSDLAELARLTLEKLKEDDSRTVSLAAVKQLSGPRPSMEESDHALEKAAQEKVERDAAEKARKEQEASRKATRELAKQAAAEQAERRAAQIAAFREIFSKSFTTLNATLPKAKPYLKGGVVLAVVAALLWMGWRMIPSLMPTPSTATSPAAAEVTELFTPQGTAGPSELPPTQTKAVEPTPVETLTETL